MKYESMNIKEFVKIEDSKLIIDLDKVEDKVYYEYPVQGYGTSIAGFDIKTVGSRIYSADVLFDRASSCD